MTTSLKQQTGRGALWSTIERFSVQFIGFAVIIIMARILTPADYGLVGSLTIFIDIAQSLVDSGFSQALIRKRDRTAVDDSTVFYFNISVAVGLYLLFFFGAPLISDYYDKPILTPMLRVISLSFIINSLVVVQRAILTVDLDFKTQAKASLTAALIAGAAGIYMAYAGWGVWAIVFYQIANYLINALLLWVLSKWRPVMAFSRKSFGEMFAFGSKLAVSGVIDVTFRDLYMLLISKLFSFADAGYYTRAHQFASFPSSNLSAILQRVSYPVLCRMQDDDDALTSAFVKFLRVSSFVIFVPMMLVAAVAVPMIAILLKEKWLPAAPILQILCLSMMWYPIQALNLNLLQVKGRSDLFLKLEIIKKILFVGIIFATVPIGLMAMCWGLVGNSLIALAINSYYTRKLIGFGLFAQMRAIVPALLYALSGGAAAMLTVYLLPGYGWQFALGTVAGLVSVVVICRLTGSRELRTLTDMIRNRR